MDQKAITAIRRAAYETACCADDLWQDELEAEFGDDANAARYDSKRNQSTPRLKVLYEVKNSSADTWHALTMLARGEIPA